MEEHNNNLAHHGKRLTEKEIRDVITPYEFGVSQHLIGTALARPMRRAVALSLDLLFVAMLTGLPSFLFAAIATVFFWRAGNNSKKKPKFPWLRKVLRFFAAIMLFALVLALIDEFKPNNSLVQTQINNTGLTMDGTDGVQMAAVALTYMRKLGDMQTRIDDGKCSAVACWTEFSQDLGRGLASSGLPASAVEGIFTEISQKMAQTLDEQQREQVMQTLQDAYASEAGNSLKDQLSAEKSASKAKDKKSKNKHEDKQFDIPVNDDGDPSILAWIRGIAEDLGIGFGWAALYFTAFTVWLNGQTPGKKIMKIKVIKLDGGNMTLWESFERYGGYGAGLATGLLGFIQVFWDPNRQAIQDKISETLVIRLGLPKLDIEEIGQAMRTNPTSRGESYRSQG